MLQRDPEAENWEEGFITDVLSATSPDLEVIPYAKRRYGSTKLKISQRHYANFRIFLQLYGRNKLECRKQYSVDFAGILLDFHLRGFHAWTLQCSSASGK